MREHFWGLTPSPTKYSFGTQHYISENLYTHTHIHNIPSFKNTLSPHVFFHCVHSIRRTPIVFFFHGTCHTCFFFRFELQNSRILFPVKFYPTTPIQCSSCLSPSSRATMSFRIGFPLANPSTILVPFLC